MVAAKIAMVAMLVLLTAASTATGQSMTVAVGYTTTGSCPPPCGEEDAEDAVGIPIGAPWIATCTGAIRTIPVLPSGGEPDPIRFFDFETPQQRWAEYCAEGASAADVDCLTIYARTDGARERCTTNSYDNYEEIGFHKLDALIVYACEPAGCDADDVTYGGVRLDTGHKKSSGWDGHGNHWTKLYNGGELSDPVCEDFDEGRWHANHYQVSFDDESWGGPFVTCYTNGPEGFYGGGLVYG